MSTAQKSSKQIVPNTSDRKRTSSPKAAWHKPRIQRLRISVDTSLFGGSNADATGRGTP